MPISIEHKAVFIHIPKTGGRAVSKLMGITKDVRANLYHKELTHLTLPMIEERINVDGFYVFAFIRDPYARIISIYNWRMRNYWSPDFQEPIAAFVSFDYFMEILLERWDSLSNVWNARCLVIPQVDYLTDDRINIFRYENIQSECDILKRMFRIKKPLEQVNVSSDYRTCFHSTLPSHTERTKEITRMLYAEDFKQLNYDI